MRTVFSGGCITDAVPRDIDPTLIMPVLLRRPVHWHDRRSVRDARGYRTPRCVGHSSSERGKSIEDDARPGSPVSLRHSHVGNRPCGRTPETGPNLNRDGGAQDRQRCRPTGVSASEHKNGACTTRILEKITYTGDEDRINPARVEREPKRGRATHGAGRSAKDRGGAPRRREGVDQAAGADPRTAVPAIVLTGAGSGIAATSPLRVPKLRY